MVYSELLTLGCFGHRGFDPPLFIINQEVHVQNLFTLKTSSKMQTILVILLEIHIRHIVLKRKINF